MRSTELSRTLIIASVAWVIAAGWAIAASKPMPSFVGEWRLDVSKSDVPTGASHGGGGMGGPPTGGGGWGGGGGGWGGGGGHGGHWGGGGGHHHEGGGAGGPTDSTRAPRGGGMRMPRDMRIEQLPGLLRLEDSTGVAFREIAFNDSAATSATTGPGEFFGGRWNGDRLEVEHTSPDGATVTERYALEDHGKTLTIKVRMMAESGSAHEMERVYRKVETP